MQVNDVVALGRTFGERPGPGVVLGSEWLALRPEPLELACVTGRQLVGGAPDDGRKSLIGEHDVLFEIENHEAFRQCVEGGAHVGRDGLRWIQMLEHPAQVKPEQDERGQRHEQHQLGQRMIE